MQSGSTEIDYSQTIPGIDDYSAGYYAITVLGWVVFAVVVFSVGRFLYKALTKNFVTVTAKAADSASALSEKVLNEVRQSPGNQAKKKLEEDSYAAAALEIESGAIQKGLWAKAFADADGNDQKQKALYVKYRAEQLMRG